MNLAETETANTGNVESIWLEFINGRASENPGIRPDVFESWMRSRKLGIDPYLRRAPIVLSGEALEKELQRKREFLSVTLPVIEDIFSAVQGTGSGVWVTNEKGIIIQYLADPPLDLTCSDDNLVIGADWSEETVGTNAIGTALFLKRSVQLMPAEHYRKNAHKGCCAAAPIFGPYGEIMGILDMTVHPRMAHPHTLGMVVAGVGSIQREMRLRLSHQYILEMIESLPSGIIVVNQQGIITSMNRNACALLKSPLESFLGNNIDSALGQIDCIRKALTTGKETEEREFYYQSGKQKVHFTVTTRPIFNSMGFSDGAVVVLREIEAVFRMTGQMAGYKARFSFDDIIGEDLLFKDIMKHAKAAASTSSNILLLGASGTGKEVLAQAIHNASPRRHGPFVAINCGAIPRELVGSELFGYEEGAFTGAKRGGSPGKFELANTGTLFLDEIGDMPVDLQLMLLRVIQERIVTRLGGKREVPVDVRLIAATNKNLSGLVSDRLFREDLYYRLNVITFQLPSLRQRRGDIALLAQHIIAMRCAKRGQKAVHLSQDTLAGLERYSWPGNIRELENVIERALIFAEGSTLKIDPLSMPSFVEQLYQNPPFFTSSPSSPPGEKTARDMIIEALAFHNDNISKAAQTLGITRVTLYRRMREHGIQRKKNTYRT